MGGFKLTKFISNKKDVLFPIPDALKRNGEKGKDLTGSLPIERVLRIFWDVENDLIKFKIDLIDQPMTRRGMPFVISSIYHPVGLAGPFFFKVFVNSCMVLRKWFLTTSVKNVKYGKAV